MKIKTDGDVMRAARRIDQLNKQILDLLSDIREGEHPSAAEIDADLFHQCAQLAWAEFIVPQYFEHPEDWEEKCGHYRNKRATKAHETRKAKQCTR